MGDSDIEIYGMSWRHSGLILAARITFAHSRRGQPPFVPTDEQRKIVGVMAAMGVPQDRLRMLIINPRSGKPIEVPTLKKAFAQEIELARAQLDLVFSMTVAEGIRRGDIRFCKLYARNMWGWDRRRSDVAVAVDRLRSADNDDDQNRVEIFLIKA